MDSLSVEQLKKIPWVGTVNGFTYEPPIGKVREYAKLPFNKRKKFPLFYCWLEIINAIPMTESKILDSSCGKGMISQMLAFKGHEVHACDIKNYFDGDRSRIKFKMVDLNKKWPYADKSFNVVINCEGFQYLNGLGNFIHESGRVLYKKGILIISIPNVHSMSERYKFLTKGNFGAYHSHGERAYWQIITLNSLVEVLKHAHFQVIGIKGNIPQKNIRSQLVYYFLLIFSFLTRKNFNIDNKIFNWSHSLIITCQKI